MASASLFFDYVYTAEAAQTTLVTVSGESQTGVSGAVADETIVVNVPKAKIDALMSVGAQGTTGVGYPAVTLDWRGLATELDTKWADLLAISDVPTTFEDDSVPNPAAISTLQTVFASQGFTFSNVGNTPDQLLLLTIPPEAISKVGVTGTISLAGGYPVDLMVGSGTLLGTTVTAPNTNALSDPQELAVRGLFLQALAAGRYDQSGSTAAGNANLPATASPGFDFSVGDTITFYSRFSLTKTREYIPDPADQLNGVGGVGFKINGTNLVIDAGPEDRVLSTPREWTVAWQVTVVA